MSTHCRIWRTVAGGVPMVCTELNPRPIQNSARPGANSATVLAAEAITDRCLVMGFSTAAAIRIFEVAMAAAAMLTKTSRSSIWESNIPTPSKPASSHRPMKLATSVTGAHGGTLRSI